MSSLPRVLVIGGAAQRFSAKEKPEIATYMHAVESWVFATNGDYINFRETREQDIENYDIVILNTSGFNEPEIALRYRHLAERRPAHCRWVTMIEGDMLAYLKPHEHLDAVFNASNLINCINKYALPFFQSMTTTRVEFLGIPVPYKGINSFATPPAARKREALICPLIPNRCNEYYALQPLGIPLHGYVRTLSRKFRNLANNWKEHRTLLNKKASIDRSRRLFANAHIHLHPECWFSDYYRQAGSLWFWMNLDERYTWGRYVLDAAALQVPIITTKATGHGEELFPLTTVQNAFDVDEARQLAIRLLEDEDFYRSVVERSQVGLQAYAPDIMRDKLYRLLGM